MEKNLYDNIRHYSILTKSEWKLKDGTVISGKFNPLLNNNKGFYWFALNGIENELGTFKIFKKNHKVYVYFGTLIGLYYDIEYDKDLLYKNLSKKEKDIVCKITGGNDPISDVTRYGGQQVNIVFVQIGRKYYPEIELELNRQEIEELQRVAEIVYGIMQEYYSEFRFNNEERRRLK